jgi:hypothetical protein
MVIAFRIEDAFSGAGSQTVGMPRILRGLRASGPSSEADATLGVH